MAVELLVAAAEAAVADPLDDFIFGFAPLFSGAAIADADGVAAVADDGGGGTGEGDLCLEVPASGSGSSFIGS